MAKDNSPQELGRQLVGMGRSAVDALKQESPEALDKLEEYTSLFDLWQRSWSKGPKGETVISSKDLQLGKQIAEQHATVLELTEKMYRSMEDSLKGLRGRSKGIRAYLDHFPSKISTIRTRKG